MIKLIGVSGSLRPGSYNTALLRAAAAVMPADSELEPLSIRGIPLYDADDEAARGIPEAAASLKDAIASADGWLLATPEYNGSIPGVTKNAIDWLSRPPGDIARVFAAKSVAVIGASPGGFGTVLAQNAWLPILRALGADIWTGGRLLVPHAAKAFGADGRVLENALEDALRKFLDGFVGYARRRLAPAKRA